jgi:hypothetical protein
LSGLSAVIPLPSMKLTSDNLDRYYMSCSFGADHPRWLELLRLLNATEQ